MPRFPFIGKLDREPTATTSISASASLESALLGRRTSFETGNLSGYSDSALSASEAFEVASSSSRERIIPTLPENLDSNSTSEASSGRTRQKSRSLQYHLQNAVAGRGLVGLAKPREEGNLLENVIVCGKSSLRLLTLGAAPGNPILSEEESDHPRRATSNLAYRRSRSRGEGASEVSPRSVTELDVRNGSKLGMNSITSVSWGYGSTSNKISTSFSNGVVVMWDLERQGSKVDQTKAESERSINRVVFGGASGSWLLTGGQDGTMRLYDIREDRSTASLALRGASPVRHLSFSPSLSQPFTVVAATGSGALIRYDLRMSGGGQSATDRIAAHPSSILSMDWRDNLPEDRAESDRGEGGWLITSGIDKTIKIWNFSEVTLASKPFRTLFTSQPIGALSWNPVKATSISAAPLPTVGINVPASTPTSLDDNSIAFNCPATTEATSKKLEWTNEIQIWDVRKEFYPVRVLKTNEPVSAIIYNGDETIYSASKSTATFNSHDLSSDSYSMLDSYPHASASWTSEGSLIFLDEIRKGDSWQGTDSKDPVNSPVYRTTSHIATVTSLDNYDSFHYLAQNYLITGIDVSTICTTNASIAELSNRFDASQLWLLIKTWLCPPVETEIKGTVPPSPARSVQKETPTMTPSPHSSPLPFTLPLRNRVHHQSPLVKVLDLLPESPEEAASELNSIQREQSSSSSTSDDGLDLNLNHQSLTSPNNRSISKPITVNKTSSEETDSEMEEDQVNNLRFQAARKSRRTSSSLPLTRENLERETKINSGMDMLASILTLRPIVPSSIIDKPKSGPSNQELKSKADLLRVDEFTELMRREIKNILIDYAEKGDSQLCATVCAVLKDAGLGLQPFFVARVTRSYLDLLQQARLHVPAALLRKYCPTESIRMTTQNHVVYHINSGKSHSSICCICHVIIKNLIIFCPTCGHASHSNCITSFAKISISNSLPEASYPSTPGIPPSTPGFPPSSIGFLPSVPESSEMDGFFSSCPEGSCDCSPCILSSSLSSLANLSPRF